jgi:hypothetical protein
LATFEAVVFGIQLVKWEQAKLDSDACAVNSSRVVAHVKSIIKLPKTPIVFTREVDTQFFVF